MTLKLKISQLLTLLQNRETAKEDWLALQREGSDGQREARAKHLALDDQVEDAYRELVETLNTSRSNGLIEFDLMTLNSDETDGLRRVLSEALPAPPAGAVEARRAARDGRRLETGGFHARGSTRDRLASPGCRS
ncbi:hypothetical protein KF707_16770 [Candidatus Obscuribacterales bacterium]|nr:hypothetical protein [Candidatus Obscuribacterales bacterium]